MDMFWAARSHPRPVRRSGRRHGAEREELTLDVRRGAESLQLKMRPTPLESEGTTKPRIGIRWDTGGQLTLSHPDPVEQVYHSITSTLQTIGAVASPKSSATISAVP